MTSTTTTCPSTVPLPPGWTLRSSSPFIAETLERARPHPADVPDDVPTGPWRKVCAVSEPGHPPACVIAENGAWLPGEFATIPEALAGFDPRPIPIHTVPRAVVEALVARLVAQGFAHV